VIADDILHEKPEKQPTPPAMPGGGMGDMDF
jgi:hypothetical protein